jgi:hypothetical protein
VVQCTLKQIYSFGQVLGLGWVYLCFLPCKLNLFLDCDIYIKLSSLVPLTFYE